MTSLPDSDRPGGKASDVPTAGAADGVAAGASVAEKIIERFGGIRPTAAKLEVPVTTVQGWKKRGAIPPTRIEDLRAAAGRFGIIIDDHEFEALARSDGRAGSLPAPGQPRSAPVTPPRPAAPVGGTAVAPAERTAAAAPDEVGAAAPTDPGPVPADPTPAPATAAPATAAPAAAAATSAGLDPIPELAAAAVAAPSAMVAPMPLAITAPAITATAAPLPSPGLRSVPASPSAVAIPPPPPAPLPPIPIPPMATLTATTPLAAVPAPGTPARATAAAHGAGSIVSRTAARPSTAIAGGADIPPVAIPRYEVPPARVPLTEDPDEDDLAAIERPVPPAAEPRGRRPVASAADPSAHHDAPAPDKAAPRSAAGPATAVTADRWASLSFGSAVIAVIMAGMTVVSALWPDAPAQGPAANTYALERRVGDLESKISRVSLDTVGASTALERRLNAVDTRITEVTDLNAAEASRLGARIDGVERSLAEFNQRIMALPVGSPTLAKLLSAAQLRGALATWQPFQSELAAVRIAGFGDPALRTALDEIGPMAPRGIGTDVYLADQFRNFYSAQIVTAATSYRPIARLMDSFAGLLETFAPPIYRLTGLPEGDSARALIARAEGYLATGNLQRAADLVSRLTGTAAEQAAPWLTQARERLAAERVRTLLNNEMVALVSTVGPQSAPR